MDSLIWVAGALVLLAAIDRAMKRRDRIDWRSRGVLAALTILVCIVFDAWIHAATLNAAEWSANFGQPVRSIAATIAPYYDSILLPVYAGVLAILIDQLARAIARKTSQRFEDRSGRLKQLWRAVVANTMVVVAVPALLYAVASKFARNDSILGEAAQASLTPALKLYGVPAYLLVDRWGSSGADWYRTHSYWSTGGYEFASLFSFVHDAGPWLALAIVGACIALRSSTADSRTLREYFRYTDERRNSRFGMFGPWRARIALAFTLAWLSALMISIAAVYLIGAFSYIVIWLAVLLVVGGMALLFGARTSKQR